jgi:hypothetical protein
VIFIRNNREILLEFATDGDHIATQQVSRPIEISFVSEDKVKEYHLPDAFAPKTPEAR